MMKFLVFLLMFLHGTMAGTTRFAKFGSKGESLHFVVQHGNESPLTVTLDSSENAESHIVIAYDEEKGLTVNFGGASLYYPPVIVVVLDGHD